LAMPTPMRIWAACQSDTPCPVTVREGADWLSDQACLSRSVEASLAPTMENLVKDNSTQKQVAVALKDIWFRYEKNSPDVLKGLSFEARYGEITAILGGNGTGKTTALGVIARLHKPYRGKVRCDTRAYVLPQNPQALFLDSNLYDLSGGEQQRAAFEMLLANDPKILLLDEPTKGLDAEYKQDFAAILKNLTKKNVAIVLVSHDVEFCAEYADRCALFFDGEIITENTTREFFSGNSFYTTSANRMSRHVLPHAITSSDVVHSVLQN